MICPANNNNTRSQGLRRSYGRFLERHVQSMEEDLRQHDQRRIFQCLKPLNIEGTQRVSSQYIRDKEGRMLRDPGLVLGRCARVLGYLSQREFGQAQTRNPRRALPVACHIRSRGRTDIKRVIRSLEVDDKREGSRTRRTPC